MLDVAITACGETVTSQELKMTYSQTEAITNEMTWLCYVAAF